MAIADLLVCGSMFVGSPPPEADPPPLVPGHGPGRMTWCCQKWPRSSRMMRLHRGLRSPWLAVPRRRSGGRDPDLPVEHLVRARAVRFAGSPGRAAPPSCEGDRAALVGHPRAKRPPGEGRRPAEPRAIPLPHCAGVPAGERPAQDQHRDPAKPAGVDDTHHLDSQLSELSRRSAPIGPGSGSPADDDRSYVPGVGDCGRCAILFYCVNDMVCFETSEWGSYCYPGSTQQSDRALGQGTLAAVAKADMFAAIPLVILRLLQAFLHNPQYRQPAVLDFIKMRTVTILSDPSDEMNTSLLGDVLVVDPVNGP